MVPEIILLEDNEQLRFVLPAMITRRLGVSCMGLASVAEMCAQKDSVLASRVAILDLNLGPGEPTGLDAFHWLKGQAFAGVTFFLTGHAVAHAQWPEVVSTGVQVLEKPLGTMELLTVLREALKQS